MAFCVKCGAELVDGAKFCQKCGTSTINHNDESFTQRQQEYAGKLYKCPNCGEILKSFVRNCPTCGLELRAAKASTAVREFALKLEAIESRREYEKPRGIFSALSAQLSTSKTDEQKTNLIKSFSVPNTKEDILEFMILATSNVNFRSYASLDTPTKGEKAINDAWISKIKQVYEKAKWSYGDEKDFEQIQELYDKCNIEIRKSKVKGITKWILLFLPLPAFLILISVIGLIWGPGAQSKEIARLEAIEREANEALENGEYKRALLNAEGLKYDPRVSNDNTSELRRQWNIKRELLIDEIIAEAEKNGVYLERSADYDTDETEISGGFTEGFKEGLHKNDEAIKENIDEFNQIMQEGKENRTSESSLIENRKGD